MRIKIIFLAWLLLGVLPPATTLDRPGEQEAVSGLETALTRSASAAFGVLGMENCFPDNLQCQYSRQPEGLQPESALASTHSLFTMIGTPGVEDAKSILTTGDSAATNYFRHADHAAQPGRGGTNQATIEVITKARSP